MKFKYIAALFIALSFGNANAITVNVGDTIFASNTYGPITLSQTPPNDAINLAGIGGPIAATTTVAGEAYDFAEVFILDPDSSLGGFSLSSSISGASQAITEAYVAILDNFNVVQSIAQVSLSGVFVSLPFYVPADPNFGVAFIGTLDDSQVSDTGQYLLNLEVTAVPVPAAVWLFGTAMLGLFGFKRKSMKGKALSA